jgi:hypothetical protein
MPAGTDPQDIYSNGRWFSRSGQPVQQYVLAQSGTPIAVPSSGSVAANGAVTLTTAMPINYGAIWLYFPAGALFTASTAGFYYCVMSSTSAATAYNIRLTSGTPYVPTATALTAGAIVAAGPGAYTQTTGSQLDAVTISVPGGALGPNGWLTWWSELTAPNNANAKAVWHTFGGTNLGNATITTATALRVSKMLANRGSQAAQFLSQLSTGFSTTGSPAANLTVDTTNAQSFVTRLQLTVDTDYLVLEAQSATVLPA